MFAQIPEAQRAQMAAQMGMTPQQFTQFTQMVDISFSILQGLIFTLVKLCVVSSPNFFVDGSDVPRADGPDDGHGRGEAFKIL